MKRPGTDRLLASNRRAGYEYHLEDRFEAGISLLGTEVKAARQGKIQLKDGYVDVRNGEAWLVGVHIGAYSHGNLQNHPPERDRKLLLHRREIDKIFGRTTAQGLTCVPLKVFLKGNKIKVEIALGRGKRQYDKRESEKRRRLDQEAREALTRRN